MRSLANTKMIDEIVSLAETADAIFLLVVSYQEADGMNGVGLVYRTNGRRDDAIDCVISTNDFIRSIWVSPSGALWLSSESGNVWTTASVPWKKRKDDDIAFDVYDASFSWKWTTLTSQDRCSPTLGSIWGTSDSDVYIGDHIGGIYHWDGKSWTVVYTAKGSITSFGGSSPKDVWAVGENGALAHFDGKIWQQLSYESQSGDETFTGVCVDHSSVVYICSQSSGLLLQGTDKNLKIVAQNDKLQLRGIAFLGERLLLACGSGGVAELQDGKLKIIRSTFNPIYITAGKCRVFFLDATCKMEYVEYDPLHPEHPWYFVTY